jgi:hypothetical protein
MIVPSIVAPDPRAATFKYEDQPPGSPARSRPERRNIHDFYATAEEAKAALEQIFADEPELEGALWVEPVALDLSTN